MALSIIQPTKKIYSMSKLHYEYVKEDRYLYLYDQQNQMLYYTTPILKVYKNLYESNNNYYLVLDLDNEDDVNNDIYNFKSKLDKLYGKSQDEVRKNYKEIFSGSKGIIDNITYETCVKRPFTGSRGQLIKLLIPEEDEELFKRIENVLDGENIRCEMVYKGLKKIQGGKMLEEYVLINFITEQEWMSELTRKMLNPYRTNLNIHIEPTPSTIIHTEKEEENTSLTHIKTEESKMNIQENESISQEIIMKTEFENLSSLKDNKLLSGYGPLDPVSSTPHDVALRVEDSVEEGRYSRDNDKTITFMDGMVQFESSTELPKKAEEESQEIKNSDDEYEDLMDVISLMDKENIEVEEIKKEKRSKKDTDKKTKKKSKEEKEKKELQKNEKKKDFLHKMKKINEPESLESDSDNLSDNEEFSKLSKKEKDKFRKIYKNMKRS
jgi:hypothetical protein